MTGSVIAKNEPKNSNVKISKNPKIWNKLNIKSLEIIETKQQIYDCDYSTLHRNIEKYMLPQKN